MPGRTRCRTQSCWLSVQVVLPHFLDFIIPHSPLTLTAASSVLISLLSPAFLIIFERILPVCSSNISNSLDLKGSFNQLISSLFSQILSFLSYLRTLSFFSSPIFFLSFTFLNLSLVRPYWFSFNNVSHFCLLFSVSTTVFSYRHNCSSLLNDFLPSIY